MNEVCIRCMAQVEVQKISWKFDEKREISLTGLPVFVRITLLGDTQTTPLSDPVFPLCFNHCMTFDRVFTNCKLQSLLPEMLRDETTTIELIQLKPDYSGGKILARYQINSYSFLFAKEITNEYLVMRASRRYTYPPHMYLSTSVTISDVIVKSPLKSINCLLTDRTTPNDPAIRLKDVINTTQDTLRSATGQSSSNRKVNFSDLTASSFANKTPTGKIITSTPTNKTGSTPTNRISSTPTNRISSTPTNRTSSNRPSTMLTNKAGSIPTNRAGSTPANRAGSTPTNRTRTPPTNRISSTPTNRTSSTPINSTSCTGSNVINKYLRGCGTVPTVPSTSKRSPYERVQSKVNEVLERYQDSVGGTVQVEGEELDMLGDVGIEGDERIRNSFAAERDDVLSRTSQMIPQDSLLTRLGPTDYWSQQVSQYNGQSHRKTFTEIMEKIYSRLYQQSLD